MNRKKEGNNSSSMKAVKKDSIVHHRYSKCLLKIPLILLLELPSTRPKYCKVELQVEIEI